MQGDHSALPLIEENSKAEIADDEESEDCLDLDKICELDGDADERPYQGKYFEEPQIVSEEDESNEDDPMDNIENEQRAELRQGIEESVQDEEEQKRSG